MFRELVPLRVIALMKAIKGGKTRGLVKFELDCNGLSPTQPNMLTYKLNTCWM